MSEHGCFLITVFAVAAFFAVVYALMHVEAYNAVRDMRPVRPVLGGGQ